jgi:hypothetical protein
MDREIESGQGLEWLLKVSMASLMKKLLCLQLISTVLHFKTKAFSATKLVVLVN